MSEIEDLPTSQRPKSTRKAVILKREKVSSHPYLRDEDDSRKAASTVTKTTVQIGGTRYEDTGGGFLLKVEPEKKAEPEKPIVEDAPILGADRPVCELCEKPFSSSFLFDKFEFKCCDICRNPTTHKLITKTEAKDVYLLKDCDFDKREPPLKCIRQKNPHNSKWSELKLYLEVQVEKRALEVWGTQENIEEQKEKREEKRVVSKSKKYQKELTALRKFVRSSLYDRTSAGPHTHTFEEETYDEEEDAYHRKCTTCPYEETFEKM